MNDVAVLIGGKAGDGINSAGSMVAQLLNHIGYSVYVNFDYPSLIRGGHNFAIVRGSKSARSPGTCREKVDFILALDQATVEMHQNQQNPSSALLFTKGLVKADGQVVPVKEILVQENAPEIMGNSAFIGGFAKAAGISWETVEQVFHAHVPKGADLNLRVAQRAYDQLATVRPIPRCANPPRPLLTGNEAVGIGLVRGGLDAYVSYPMTPSSSLLHFLAGENTRFGITVVHPENEIAVILMALGFAAAGKRAAVGTSGGGFCLMTEGLSLAGMAELPVVILMSQRTGPSTGLPTYTGQSDLRFVLHAGQGEFPRLIVAPGDASEAILWSARAMELAWRCQLPAFILTDKTLSEGTYSVDLPSPDKPTSGDPVTWDRKGDYLRYADTPSGIPPLAFAGSPGAIVKVNSYAHDESGITTEDAAVVVRMVQKRMRKGQVLVTEIARYTVVDVSGIRDAATAILCWGSTRGVCEEAATSLGLRVVRPVVLTPFPLQQLKTALAGVTRLIAVEESSTAQLADLAQCNGIAVHDTILRFDGRPFTPEDLAGRIREVL
ncbi:MAG: 2-oxoacid:acceptor oxidoreductase subunit alpha [Methanoregula sp.]|jgi:2-oxoglutarate ferredoxin oxidoreductase subunit alpha|nr:2-oxoacid:acceptor oxidoreductase subunit alpha [Methanoregula sp.]